ncbi:hypothetical protein D9757_010385 [Collybiopsis confluens]|uniref:Lectin n=1 Tax=Collybiopsis confluens TaxID=2823264 RepID=A0A8H5GV03_9AGAR|nr:hypothetical protein D9757_010385 [Collybiopsis confluens]
MSFNGKYRIQNVQSGYFLHADKSISSGDTLITSPAPATFDESYAFYIKTVSGGLALFTSSYKSLIAGVGDSVVESAPIVWKRGEQLFQVNSVSPADQIYNIRLTSVDFYWFDDKASGNPYRTVLLREGSNKDQTAWRILPAA